ncbi:hypothetical protein H6S82_18075 [Planktothrix sp. FACHB-1355]|uniref:Uncharacterized protein n=1 Tax=Aerosakkonema funiforme FACHB-1375 TaxID=2949571 RepID=A0A926VFY3_9CYAN|nr:MULTISPECIES: hypothetical protein [Oscillatoriales]MBD2183251.1 hypothetical protein [Aerosakkonema funiforme FACHB-1375]MBD3560741.1 hypothetical protein [Planktothrix sp. FACHB-1355]
MQHNAFNGSLKSIPTNQIKPTLSCAPLSLFKSGQLLYLTPESEGGLILQNPYYADFVGPGAAVGSYFDIKCISVYAIGTVNFHAPVTYSERLQAFQRRMAYIDKLKEILLEPSRLDRACLLLTQLCEWLGDDEVRDIPHKLTAKLIAVQAEIVKKAWQQRLRETTTKKSETLIVP